MSANNWYCRVEDEYWNELPDGWDYRYDKQKPITWVWNEDGLARLAGLISEDV